MHQCYLSKHYIVQAALLLLAFLLVSCSQSSFTSNVSGGWDVVITKSDGETNYGVAELYQEDSGTNFDGWFYFTMLNANDAFILGDASTGKFRIDESGGDTYINVSGKFAGDRYSGSYTAYYPSGLVNKGKLEMTRFVQPISVMVSPEEATLKGGQTREFTAAVTGTDNTQVTWSATCGTVDADGLYTAPNNGETCDVTATSVEDSTKSATATVTVTGVRVAITPEEVALEANEERSFTATVENTPNTAVTWFSTGGTLTESGNSVTYRAPSDGGIYTLTATSQADPSRKASTKIVVKSSLDSSDWRSLPNWFTYQANESHTGYLPITLDPEKFVESWTTSFDETLNPVADGAGQVYVSTQAYFGSQFLYAIDAFTGEVSWKMDFGDIHSVHPPATAYGKVFVTTGGHGDSYLWGFDERDGAAVVRSPFGNQWSRYYAPTPFDNNIYISGGYYGGAYAFGAEAGSELWFTSLNQYDEWTPVVDENYVYAYTGSVLSILNRQGGEVEFSINAPNVDWGMGLTPVKGSLDNILAIHNSRLISFDLQGREIGWELDENFSGQPSVANGVIYAVNGGNVQARREADGTLLWQWIPTSGDAADTMVLTDNLLFVGVGEKTYAVDLATHEAVWDYPAQGHLALSNEGNLYIATREGELTAINVR